MHSRISYPISYPKNRIPLHTIAHRRKSAFALDDPAEIAGLVIAMTCGDSEHGRVESPIIRPLTCPYLLPTVQAQTTTNLTPDTREFPDPFPDPRTRTGSEAGVRCEPVDDVSRSEVERLIQRIGG